MKPEARSIAQMFQTPDFTQSGARVPAAGPPQGARDASAAQGRTRACGRRRRHGRRHRQLVRGARSERDAAGSGTQVHHAGARSGEGLLREALSRRVRAARPSPKRLQPDVEGSGAATADVVIEAIFENAEAKRELYARLEPQMKADAILGTNTSSIMLETLAHGACRPGPARRPALLQSGREDAAGGSHPRRVDTAGSAAGGDRFHAPDRQAAAALPERAGLRRQPHPDALHDAKPCCWPKKACRSR